MHERRAPELTTPGAHVETTAPRNPEIGVIALVPDRWGPQWQVRQHVLTRLASHFQVVWMNPAHHWRQAWDRRGREPAVSHGEMPSGFSVYTPPFWLPRWHGSEVLSRWSLRQRLRHARSLLRERGATRIVLYLWRPEFAEALSGVPHDLSCYHIDDEYSFSLTEVETSDEERRLIESVDQVFIHSPGLMEKKGRVNPRTEYVPLGVNFAEYSLPLPVPPDLSSIPRPRIGYIGVLKKTLDWPLLERLIARHPEWSFVFLGPRAPHPEIDEPIRDLEPRPNVHFLPARPTMELKAYPQHLDVCIMPYVLNPYARYGYPLKCHEYLAGGRPVVGSRMRTLEDLEDVVLLADTEEEWEQRIQTALKPSEQAMERIAARKAVARSHDWDDLVGAIATRMEERLAERTEAVGWISRDPGRAAFDGMSVREVRWDD